MKTKKKREEEGKGEGEEGKKGEKELYGRRKKTPMSPGIEEGKKQQGKKREKRKEKEEKVGEAMMSWKME